MLGPESFALAGGSHMWSARLAPRVLALICCVVSFRKACMHVIDFDYQLHESFYVKWSLKDIHK